MITNFEQFADAKEASDWEMTEENLSEAERLTLKVVVSTWDTEQLQDAMDVLNDYYAMEVPAPFIKEILACDLDLAMEVATGGIRDTCQRDLLVDSVLKKIGMRAWPCNYEGKETFIKFAQDLKAKLESIGGKIIE